MKKNKEKVCVCIICGYSWKSRVEKPRQCPNCKRQIQYDKNPKGFQKGDKNPSWKGDDVGYGSLHDYVKYHFPKPEKCQVCKEIKELDLANISGNYKRDLTDWEWLCRKCHMEKDGRAEKLRFTGHKHTDKTKEKMSISLKARPNGNGRLGKKNCKRQIKYA